MEPPTTDFNEPLVVALCQSIYSGKTAVAGGAFQAFIFPSEGLEVLRYAIRAVKSVVQQTHRSWAEAEAALAEFKDHKFFSGNQPFIQELLRHHDRMEAALRELADHPIPDFKGYMRCLTSAAGSYFSPDVQREAISVEFDIGMREALVSAGKTAYYLLNLNGKLLSSTNVQVQYKLDRPDPRIISTVLQMLGTVLTNILTARDAFLNCQLPSFTPLAILDAVSKKKTIAQGTPIRYFGGTTATIEKPGYIGKEGGAPEAVQDIINGCKGVLENNLVSPIIAARIWSLYRDFKSVGGVPGAVMPPIQGGAMESAKPVLGGAAQDANTMRVAANNKFGQRIVGSVKSLASAIEALANNPSTQLINFLADSATRPLIAAFTEVKFPSNSYIPILSGYYRSSEVAARRKRYLETLGSLVVLIEKVAGPSAKLDGASRNSFTKCKSTLREMIHSIEDSNRQMDNIFARLAAGQIAEVTSGDTSITSGQERVSSVEAGGQTGDEYAQLTKALERLRATAHSSSTKKNILGGIDQIDDYLRKGKGICEEAIKNRLADLTLSYQGMIGRVSTEARGLAKKVVEFKLDSYRDFYQVLTDTEMYLAKAHKSFVASPAVRDELYRAIAGWTLAAQKSSTLEDRFAREAEALLHSIFESDDKAIFSYEVDVLQARRLGHVRLAGAVADAEATGDIEKDNKMYDQFRRSLLQMLNYCPQLRLVFDLVNIIEKTFGRGFDTKKFFEAAVRFIVAASIDVCRRSEALTSLDAAGMRGAGYHFVGRYDAAGTYQAADAGNTSYYATGAVQAITAPSTESTNAADLRKEDVGVFFRHSISQLRLEDELFVRWMKAICANLLLALDRDRATHGVEKVNLPGAERLLVGGALDDPIGITGSTHVVPEVVPLYIAFPTACRAYEAYFTWESKTLDWKDSDEPRLIAEVQRSSRFYTILELVRGKKSKEALSETYISQMVAATNEIWGHYASVSDPAKRVTAILDAFFDEINNSLLLRMTSEHDEADARRAMEKDQDAISGVGFKEDRIETLQRTGDARRNFRKKILNALKGISMSVYDIMSKVGTSEETMANDYKAYIDRLQKRIGDVPDQDRFRELVRAMQTPDETIGDVQGLFVAFVEFVVTPLFLITSVTENFVYRAANLYMQILRCLFAARMDAGRGIRSVAHGAMPPTVAFEAAAVIAETGLDAAGAALTTVAIRALFASHIALTAGIVASVAVAANAGNVADINAAAAILAAISAPELAVIRGGIAGADHLAVAATLRGPSLARHWFAYGGHASMIGRDNVSHADRIKHVLANMTHANFEHLGDDVAARNRQALHRGTERYFLHMHQPIYKALQLLLDVGGDFFDFTAPTDKGATTAKINADRFRAFIDDSVSDLKASLGVFMKIGKKEHADNYYRDITSWNPKDMLGEVMTDVNAALGIVHCDFYMLREYLPTAVCFDENQDADPTAAAAATATAAGTWHVNFRRNSADYTDDIAKARSNALIAYHESVNLLIGSPTRWSLITGAPQGNAGGYAALDWTTLGARHGIFAPMIKSASKVGPGTGFMPWTDADTHVIESGWDTSPVSSVVHVGAGLNSPALYSPVIPGGVAYNHETDFAALNLGGWVRGIQEAAAVADGIAATHRMHTIAVAAVPAIRAVSSQNVIQSLLYSGPSYGTKAETFNRLLAKMASCLSLQGEQACVLYDLSNAMVSHQGLATYFQTVDVTVTGTDAKQMLTLTCFPEAIGTPVRTSAKWHAVYNDGKIWNTRDTGAAVAGGDAAETTIPSPLTATNNGSFAPEYKSGTFIYDVVLAPFYNSAHGKTTRRVGELTNLEMSKYLASIPQFLTAFKALLKQVQADLDMGVNDCTDTLNITGRMMGVDRRKIAGAVAVYNSFHSVGVLDGLTGIPNKLKAAIIAVIDCLTQCYRAIHERYGSPVHMEMAKGDFDPYLTGGKFDTTKLTTPMSMIAGLGFVGENGPVVMANFGERGSRHSDTAMALAWATPIAHKELVNMEVVPLSSVPWTVALAERMKKMTHASLDTVLQSIVTRVAKLGCVQNGMNLTALACHNPWGCNSVPSVIFHPHLLDLSLASMHAGFDLMRGFDHANVHDPAEANHSLAEASLPTIATFIPAVRSLAEPIYHADLLGAAAATLGPWASAPFPITYGIPHFDPAVALSTCYTANPYAPSKDEQTSVLNRGTEGTEVVREIGTARLPIIDVAARRLHVTNSQSQLGNMYIDDRYVGVAISGPLIASLMQQLDKGGYEQKWLKDAKQQKHLLKRVQSYGPEKGDSEGKAVSQWVSNKTKAKDLIDKQVGFKIAETAKHDGAYTEMVRFSPPKERWSDTMKPEERHMAGLFMHLKRNPVSILSTLRLVPFASIYTFSEAFDLYFQLAAVRSKKMKGGDLVRSNVPSLITEPLSISGKFKDFSADKRAGRTWILSDADRWADLKEPYGKRKGADVHILRAVGEDRDRDEKAYQSFRPAEKCTSIPHFYGTSARISGQMFGLSAPSNGAVVNNRALTAFPLFAMYIRMLDQYGITLKDELATRLGEIRYDKPESLAQYQNALINVLDADHQ